MEASEHKEGQRIVLRKFFKSKMEAADKNWPVETETETEAQEMSH